MNDMGHIEGQDSWSSIEDESNLFQPNEDDAIHDDFVLKDSMPTEMIGYFWEGQLIMQWGCDSWLFNHW